MADMQDEWRTVLVTLRRHFLQGGASTALTRSGFAGGKTSSLGVLDGEQLWGLYAIGATPTGSWWEARFTDTKVTIVAVDNPLLVITYGDMFDTRSLPGKSIPPMSGESGGVEFHYDEATIQGLEGRTYRIRGAVDEDGLRDVYRWHNLVKAAHIDRHRHQTGQPTPLY